jgi:hypothetical protein
VVAGGGKDVQPDRQFVVYVIDVEGGPSDEVYVGQTWHSGERRRREHIDGVRRGQVFKRKGREVGQLRPDLLPALEPLTSRELAVAAEAYVAAVLRAQGYTVHGGH